MLEKAITGTDGQNVTLKMAYNAANQLTGMTNGQSKLAYSYDKNGSLIQKTLTSKTYGKLTDRYAYDALDQLTSYVGYDGYQQQFTYDANGMRLSKKETGDTSRSTLEELLRGNIAGLPEIVVPQAQDDAADVPEELAWATTDYLYDITQEYYQVISETRTETNGHTATTAYAYGLERIAAYTADGKTSYVYDGRGSVVQAVTAPVAGERVSSVLPDVAVKVQSFSYTAFGEQMGAQKVSGFAYNAEAYDAVTGMINLRARQYEPTIGRFEQKDRIQGYEYDVMSYNYYVYVFNAPINYIDALGLERSRALKNALESASKILKSIKSNTKNVKNKRITKKDETVRGTNIDVNLKVRGTHTKDELMSLNYLAAAQGIMYKNGYIYAADRIPNAKTNPPKVECVGIARLPAISWYELSFSRTIKSTASGTYKNATHKGEIIDGMEMFNGMQLFTKDKNHVVTYWKSVILGDGNYYEDIIVESNGRQYSDKYDNGEVDKYNKKNGRVKVYPYSEVSNKFVYWCSLDYVDYEDQKDPLTGEYLTNREEK